MRPMPALSVPLADRAGRASGTYRNLLVCGVVAVVLVVLARTVLEAGEIAVLCARPTGASSAGASSHHTARQAATGARYENWWDGRSYSDLLDSGALARLYGKYDAELREARRLTSYYHRFGRHPANKTIQCLSTNVEMEITYMRLREVRPQAVMEASPETGCSTVWLLRAMRLNAVPNAVLHSFDIARKPLSLDFFPADAVPHASTGFVYRFWGGDIHDTYVPAKAEANNYDYIYIDMAHTVDLSDWVARVLLPSCLRSRQGQASVSWVSVHDMWSAGGWYEMCRQKSAALEKYEDSVHVGMIRLSNEGLITLSSIVFDPHVRNLQQFNTQQNSSRFDALRELRQRHTNATCERILMRDLRTVPTWCESFTLWYDVLA